MCNMHSRLVSQAKKSIGTNLCVKRKWINEIDGVHFVIGFCVFYADGKCTECRTKNVWCYSCCLVSDMSSLVQTIQGFPIRKDVDWVFR